MDENQDQANNASFDVVKIGRWIVKGVGILLCLLFFTMPLIECSSNSSLNATGWEIATGTGDVYSKLSKDDDKKKKGGNPLVFILIIIPVILLITAFKKASFTALRNISIAGLVAKIIFMIVTHIELRSDEVGGTFVLTSYNWFVIAIYVGLVCFTQYCIIKGEGETE
jgi:hypothetical protein